jgi:hypothetical protein
MGVALAGAVALLALAGCARSEHQNGDAIVEFECCDGTRLTVCRCGPTGTCNYQPYVRNPDGVSCRFGVDGPDAGADAAADAAEAGQDARADVSPDLTPPDAALDLAPPDARPDAPPDLTAGGFHYECCDTGRVETCYCPPNRACNYAPVVRCGDGTCYYNWAFPIDAGNMCARPDGGGQ